MATSAPQNGNGGQDAPLFFDDDDENEDALDFFTMKRSYKKLAAPVETIDLEEPIAGPSDSSEGDEEGNRKKRKKRTTTKKPTRTLPAWTRSTSTDKRRTGRGSTEDRKSRDPSEVWFIGSSDEDTGTKKDKGKGKEKEKRPRIAITPPPAISAEVRAGIHKVLELPTAIITIDDDDDAQLSSAGHLLSSSPARNRSNAEKMKVHVRMVTDHTTLPPGASQNAIKQWEKKRTVTVFREDPLENLWETIAERITRPVDDLILVYDERRIISKRSTPKQLGMIDGAEIAGYEKSHWERKEKEAREERLRLVKGTPPRVEKETEQTPTGPVEPEVKKRRICLRGNWGQHKLGAAPFVTASTLAEVYCVRCSKDKSLATGLRLVFDGERLEPSVTLGELDVEDGDMIDVEEV